MFILNFWGKTFEFKIIYKIFKLFILVVGYQFTSLAKAQFKFEDVLFIFSNEFNLLIIYYVNAAIFQILCIVLSSIFKC